MNQLESQTTVGDWSFLSERRRDNLRKTSSYPNNSWTLLSQSKRDPREIHSRFSPHFFLMETKVCMCASEISTQGNMEWESLFCQLMHLSYHMSVSQLYESDGHLHITHKEPKPEGTNSRCHTYLIKCRLCLSSLLCWLLLGRTTISSILQKLSPYKG